VRCSAGFGKPFQVGSASTNTSVWRGHPRSKVWSASERTHHCLLCHDPFSHDCRFSFTTASVDDLYRLYRFPTSLLCHDHESPGVYTLIPPPFPQLWPTRSTLSLYAYFWDVVLSGRDMLWVVLYNQGNVLENGSGCDYPNVILCTRFGANCATCHVYL